jgi:hypothetical protein
VARSARLRTLAFAAITALLVAVALELGAFAVLAAAPAWLGAEVLRTPDLYARQREGLRRLLDGRSDSLFEFDAALGWKPVPSGRTPDASTNSRGARGTREYAARPPPGVRRVALFGDSFVFATEVPDQDAWPRRIEAGHPDLELHNFAVPAYGPDQAYLRFAALRASLASDVIALGITPVSLERIVNVQRAFLSPGPETFATKPRFVLDAGGALRLLHNPLPRLEDARAFLEGRRDLRELGRNDFWYEPAVYENPLYDLSALARLVLTTWSKLERRYLDPDRPLAGPRGRGAFNPDSSAFRILAAIATRFAREVREEGAAPLLLLLPDRYVVERARAGEREMFEPVLALARAESIPYLDFTDAFVLAEPPREVEDWFSGGHYSTLGNQVVADHVGPRLRELARRAGAAAQGPASAPEAARRPIATSSGP